MEIPIFCINLERAKERKENIEKQWIKELGFDINFWKAYDRRDIANNKFIYQYSKEEAISFFGRELNNGEIACATSFCMLHEYLLNNDYNEAIIMEDDIIPLIENKEELFNKVKQGKIEFPESEMMIFHKYPFSDPVQLEKIYSNKKEHFSMCEESPWGNQLFYVNKNAILKLYNMLKIIKTPADFPQHSISKECKLIISNEPLCHHYWGGPNSTTYIGNDIRNTFRVFIN
jgi:hypothetical protein